MYIIYVHAHRNIGRQSVARGNDPSAGGGGSGYERYIIIIITITRTVPCSRIYICACVKPVHVSYTHYYRAGRVVESARRSFLHETTVGRIIINNKNKKTWAPARVLTTRDSGAMRVKRFRIVSFIMTIL